MVLCEIEHARVGYLEIAQRLFKETLSSRVEGVEQALSWLRVRRTHVSPIPERRRGCQGGPSIGTETQSLVEGPSRLVVQLLACDLDRAGAYYVAVMSDR